MIYYENFSLTFDKNFMFICLVLKTYLNYAFSVAAKLLTYPFQILADGSCSCIVQCQSYW